MQVGKKWTIEEEQQLLRLYNEEKLDVIQIAEKHNRLQGGICSRLKSLKVIEDYKNARGYNEDVQKQAKDFYDKKRKEKNSENAKDVKDIKDVKDDVKKIREELKEIKMLLQQLLKK